MKTSAKQPQPVSHTIQSKTKAANQASVESVLQKYAQSIESGKVKAESVQRQANEELDEELLQGKFETAQLEAFDEDEEPLQGKFEVAQREEIDDDELLQGKFETAQREENPTPNLTGIPDQTKENFENMSGFSFDDVRVHYNSDKPAQLQALAYTQGNEVHIAPGQEKHLGHELGHVVQQKQGRVQPTTQLQGVNVNDNEGLEREADTFDCKFTNENIVSNNRKNNLNNYSNNNDIIQRLKWIKDGKNYKIFVGIGNYQDSGDEAMENFPGSDVWRPETVWDDDEKKWFEIEDSTLIERVEDIRIAPFTYQEYCENTGDKIIFGHKISFTTWFKGQEIKWEEKTNEPYNLVYATMEKDAWIDLYSILKDSSDVFAGARNINTTKYKGYVFSDPPGIFKEPNRNRILEFKISFKDISGHTKTIQATQILRTDDRGDITEQSFTYRIE
jgi:hypothetical protein